MAIFQFGQKKKLRERETPMPRKNPITFQRVSRIALWVCAFAVFISLLAFWGRPPHTPIIFKGMQPTFRFDAPFSFSYESAVRRKAKQDEALYNVVPVYRTELTQTEQELKKCSDVSEAISEKFDELQAKTDRTERLDAILAIFEEEKVGESSAELRTMLNRMAMDISLLIDSCDTSDQFRQLSSDSIALFRRLAWGGIVEKTERNSPAGTFLQSGGIAVSDFREKFSEELQVLFWRKVFTGFSSEKIDRVRAVVTDLFEPMIRPNVIFDAAETTKRKDEAVAAVPPVVVDIAEGTPLLLPGMRVDEDVAERWFAYRSAQADHETQRLGFSLSFLTNMLYVFCVVVIAGIYRALLVPAGGKPMQRRFLFAGTMATINILLIRIVLELTESQAVVQSFGSLGDALVWLSSPAVVAISVSAIAGAPLGVLSSLFVGAVASLMLGGNVQILMMISVASLIAVGISRDATKRGTLIRAGFYSGIAMAATAICIGYYADTAFPQIVANTISSILIGLFYGVVSAGLLGVLEGIFRARTNITFVELSDFNHPLLRKLQIVAPGTFHHCVMVANYAEAAAYDVGANTALCRCAALFHDIGKTLKPEYFTENQSGGPNPHDSVKPKMSALILKSHVRDGAELAAEYKLPERVRDIIEQHHGTSLASFFYMKARKQAEEAGEDPNRVDESAFRYDGPKPKTLEAAIIMMCDVVEAASRSMKKYTPQAVEELVGNLIRGRLQAGEFDECNITMAQISVIQTSLVRSLLTTYHTRIEYPKDAQSGVPASGASRPRVSVVNRAA